MEALEKYFKRMKFQKFQDAGYMGMLTPHNIVVTKDKIVKYDWYFLKGLDYHFTLQNQEQEIWKMLYKQYKDTEHEEEILAHLLACNST